MTNAIYLLVMFLATILGDGSGIIKNDKELFNNKVSNECFLEGYGRIPYDQYSTYRNSMPFTIEDNLLVFKISHGSCKYSYDMFWNGEYYKNKKGKTIIDLKFIFSANDYCKRLNHAILKYDLSEIISNSKSDKLYVNFIGYDDLIRVK